MLGFTPKGLAFVLFKLKPEAKYKTFTISKKTGGTRLIQAPTEQLKLLQERLGALLNDCLDDIEAAHPARRRVSHAFQRKRSIVTNAVPHRNCRYVLNLDLTDFFGSINFGRVRGYFITDKNFALTEEAATVIAQIACHQNRLPQGSPCSPVISNLVGHILDARLTQMASNAGCYYTRYADDLTFSTRKQTFPSALAKRSAKNPSRWTLSKPIRSEIKAAGFVINKAKTRMQIRGSRQVVTGLVTNEKINISQDYYRLVRAQCHSLFRTGQYLIPGNNEPQTRLDPLQGHLAHIWYVKSRLDRTAKLNKELKFECPSGPRELFADFSFYKHFVAIDRPKIITEGRSDIVYLRTAIISLAADFPALVEITPEGPRLKVDFFRPSSTSQKLLNVANGCGGLNKLVSEYSGRLRKYGTQLSHNPIIIVTDGDKGGDGVVSTAKKQHQKSAKSAPANFAFTPGPTNVYVVQVPKTSTETVIEDLFPHQVLGTLLNGKKFDKHKPHEDETTYGKIAFAENVIAKKMSEIDFSGFKPLLAAIADAIKHHQTDATSIAKAS